MYAQPLLQHPRPQHPPSQIPSTSPPPDHSGSFNNRDPSDSYQRFSSPPVSNAAAQHGSNTFMAGGGHPDAYMSGGHGYAAPPVSGGGGQYGGGQGAPWLGGSIGGGGGGIGGGGGGDWPGMNDATAQMGVQFGRHAFDAGSAYLDKNFTRLLPFAHLKHSFNVSNSYVLLKLRLVLWPWRHRVWARSLRRSESSGAAEGWKAPRDDINCPDLYIPAMALTTYILLSAVIAGSQGLFDPRILGQTASKAFGLLFLEFMCIKLGCYLLGIGDEGTVVDLVAYEGYKFVGVIVTLLAALLGAKGWLFWTIFVYVFFADFFFLLRSLRPLFLPAPAMSPLDHNQSAVAHAPGRRTIRIYFLFAIALTQGLSMAFLVWI